MVVQKFFEFTLHESSILLMGNFCIFSFFLTNLCTSNLFWWQKSCTIIINLLYMILKVGKGITIVSGWILCSLIGLTFLFYFIYLFIYLIYFFQVTKKILNLRLVVIACKNKHNLYLWTSELQTPGDTSERHYKSKFCSLLHCRFKFCLLHPSHLVLLLAVTYAKQQHIEGDRHHAVYTHLPSIDIADGKSKYIHAIYYMSIFVYSSHTWTYRLFMWVHLCSPLALAATVFH